MNLVFQECGHALYQNIDLAALTETKEWKLRQDRFTSLFCTPGLQVVQSSRQLCSTGCIGMQVPSAWLLLSLLVMPSPTWLELAQATTALFQSAGRDKRQGGGKQLPFKDILGQIPLLLVNPVVSS